MFKLEKLKISGIRAFSPSSTNEIIFNSPLTLIVGSNGSGKTTIIETIKFLTTGDLPPNSKNGAFISDPKMSRKLDSRAKISLTYNLISSKDNTTRSDDNLISSKDNTTRLDDNLLSFQNLQKYKVTKHIQASYKKASSGVRSSNIESRTLDSSLVQISDEGKELIISDKLTDIDKIISVHFTSSPNTFTSLLQSVIFCHQEESNWPFSDPASLKKKIDDIFNSALYIKTINELKVTRRDVNSQLKLKSSNLSFLHKEKIRRCEIESKLTENLKLYEDKTGELTNLLNIIEKLKDNKISEIDVRLKVFEKLQVNFNLLKEKQQNLIFILKEEKSNGLEASIVESINNINASGIVDKFDENYYNGNIINEAIKRITNKISGCNIRELKNAYNKIMKEKDFIIKMSEMYLRRVERVKLLENSLININEKLLKMGELESIKKEIITKKEKTKNILDNFYNQRSNLISNQRITVEIKNGIQETLKSINKFKINKKEICNELEDKYNFELLKENFENFDEINFDQIEFGIFDEIDFEIKELFTNAEIYENEIKHLSLQLEEKGKENEEMMLALRVIYRDKKINNEVEAFKYHKSKTEIQLKDLLEVNDSELLKETFQDLIWNKLSIIKNEAENDQMILEKYEKELRENSINSLRNQLNLNKFIEDIKSIGNELKECMNVMNIDRIREFSSNIEISENEDFIIFEKFNIFLSNNTDLFKVKDLLKEITEFIRENRLGHLNLHSALSLENISQSLESLKNEEIKQEGRVDAYKYLEKISTKVCGLCHCEFSESNKHLLNCKSTISVSIDKITVIKNKISNEVSLLEKKIENLEVENQKIAEYNNEITAFNNIYNNLKAEISNERNWSELFSNNFTLKEKEEIINREVKNIKNRINERNLKITEVDNLFNQWKDVNVKIDQINQNIPASPINSLNGKRLKSISEEEILSTINKLKEEIKGKNRLVNIKKELIDQIKVKKEYCGIICNLRDLHKRLKDLGTTTNYDKAIEEMDKKIKVLQEDDKEVFNLESEIKEIKLLLLNKSEIITSIKEEKEGINSCCNGKEEDIEISDFISNVSESIKKEEFYKNLKQYIILLEDEKSDRRCKISKLYLSEAFEFIRKIYESQIALMETSEKALMNIRTLESQITKKAKIQKYKEKLGIIEEELKSFNFDEMKILENQKSDLLLEINYKQENANIIKAEMVQLDKTSKSLRNELNTDYHTALEDYNLCLFEIKLLEGTSSDIDKSIRVIENSIVEYQSIKITEVNASLKELWVNTYKGGDIDYIEIKCEGSNYKIVMVKNSVEMDMRGRCSAGQKMIASLLIRIALSDAFSVNGILALDEPTSNLDSQNIEALANTINYLISNRPNTQLILITHDEDFVAILNRMGLDYYYRINKTVTGSIIKKEVIY